MTLIDQSVFSGPVLTRNSRPIKHVYTAQLSLVRWPPRGEEQGEAAEEAATEEQEEEDEQGETTARKKTLR